MNQAYLEDAIQCLSEAKCSLVKYTRALQLAGFPLPKAINESLQVIGDLEVTKYTLEKYLDANAEPNQNS